MRIRCNGACMLLSTLLMLFTTVFGKENVMKSTIITLSLLHLEYVGIRVQICCPTAVSIAPAAISRGLVIVSRAPIAMSATTFEL
ncbi:hypothetical protein RIF29_18169 [Crotalaria pallida]|uniref:Secreted protein n=1 Tax=Crotalaria pallida TaxID=3830 RepID=A0AAN9FPD9_CROPI